MHWYYNLTQLKNTTTQGVEPRYMFPLLNTFFFLVNNSENKSQDANVSENEIYFMPQKYFIFLIYLSLKCLFMFVRVCLQETAIISEVNTTNFQPKHPVSEVTARTDVPIHHFQGFLFSSEIRTFFGLQS